MRASLCICLSLCLVGCGSSGRNTDAMQAVPIDSGVPGADGAASPHADAALVDGPLADASAADAAALADASPADAAPPDACVPPLTVVATFTVNMSTRGGTSNLDPILNHTNAFVLEVNNWKLHKETVSDPLDPMRTTNKTGVQSTDWSINFSGTNAALLNSDLGQWLANGGAIGGSLFELADDGQYDLYLLPADTTMHPYMAIYCGNAPVTIGSDGYPAIQDQSVSGCNVIFYDFRSGVNKNLSGTATVAVSANACP